jgi:hypothetical protein
LSGNLNLLNIVDRSRDVYPFEVRDVGRSRVCGERTRSLASVGILSISRVPWVWEMVMNQLIEMQLGVRAGRFSTCLVVIYPGGEDWVGRIVDFHVAPGHIRDVSFCVERGLESG